MTSGDARFVGIVVAASIAVSAHAQSNVIWPNDECAFATPIAGDGAYGFDTNAVDGAGSPLVTTSLPSLPATCPGCTCGTTFGGIANDVWYLWTATCSGTVEMKTGVNGESWCNLDTVLAVYNAPCPITAAPIACCDDTCAAIGSTCHLASYVQFIAECGQQYLVRVGKKPGTAGGAGTLKISCLGTVCPPPTVSCTEPCCGAPPQFSDSLYANFLNGRVSIMTEADFAVPAAQNVVVRVFDLDATPGPCSALGSNWDPSGTTPPFRYPPPTPLGVIPINDWTQSKLGQVFGLTLDDQGNIFVAHAGIYFGVGTTTIGTIGAAAQNTSTTVYKLATGTVNGTPSVFVNLPGGSQAGSGGELEPGLGDVCFDCTTGNFFISHFGDGRIYRVGAAGTILDAYDFATNTVSSGTVLDPSGPYSTFVALGERVWAVKAHAGRLFFGVWGHNQDGHTCSGTIARGANSPIPNRIWSVAINAAGFLPATLQQELQLPFNPKNAGAPPRFSNPVSDLAFSPECEMVVAERSMSDFACDGTPSGPLTTAHRSRLLEYAGNGTTWAPTSNYNGANGFAFGASPAGNNCAGGCGIDFNTSGATCVEGRYWASGDQMVAFNVYGMAGFQTSGAAISNTIYIDYDAEVSSASADKTKQGDVELPCVNVACLTVSNGKVLCPLDGSGCYTYSFDITNHSGFPVKYITMPTAAVSPPGVTISPNVINLLTQTGQLLQDGHTVNITVTICGGEAGDKVCFRLSLQKEDFEECCFQVLCVELPECDCGQLSCQQITGVIGCGGATVSFPFSFTLENLSTFTIEDVFLIPGNDEQGTFAEDYFDVSIPPGGSLPMTVQINGALPGEEFCFFVALKHPTDPKDPDGGCCCGFEKCITVPCGGPLGGGIDLGDLPGACCLPELGTCVQTTLAGCTALGGSFHALTPCCSDPCTKLSTCQGDLNLDGVVNGLDLPLLLVQWSGSALYQTCPPFNSADCNGDCHINGIDLSMMLGAWGSCKK